MPNANSITNPNDPGFPYGGGTDNPGGDTSKAGGPSNAAATETSLLAFAGNSTNGAIPSQSLAASVARHPPLPVGLAQAGTDTPLATGLSVVPEAASGFESTVDRGADTGGVLDQTQSSTGGVRESGQDETAGAEETTSGVTPAAFPHP